MNKQTLSDRFWSKVRRSPSCWEWTAAKRKGYGSFKDRTGHNVYAHRMAWVIAYKAIPDGMCVLHSCDNPICVRVSHLFLGTTLDNNKDKVRKNRQAKGGSYAIQVTRVGESNGRAKLTRQQVKEILMSKDTQRVIAAKYNVSRSLVSFIKTGKLWVDVYHEIRP